jgi:hypothetical protein
MSRMPVPHSRCAKNGPVCIIYIGVVSVYM